MCHGDQSGTYLDKVFITRSGTLLFDDAVSFVAIALASFAQAVDAGLRASAHTAVVCCLGACYMKSWITGNTSSHLCLVSVLAGRACGYCHGDWYCLLCLVVFGVFTLGGGACRCSGRWETSTMEPRSGCSGCLRIIVHMSVASCTVDGRSGFSPVHSRAIRGDFWDTTRRWILCNCITTLNMQLVADFCTHTVICHGIYSVVCKLPFALHGSSPSLCVQGRKPCPPRSR
jgi:hypothetical protein